MSQTSKIGKTATRVYQDEDGYTCVQYHDTVVVRFNDEKIILNSGGWFTNTTKLRINQASNQFALHFQLYQEKNIWKVRVGDWDNPFYNILTFKGNTLEIQR